MLFNDVQAILSAIQADPELQRLAFAECEDLYSELFIGHGSEHTGSTFYLLWTCHMNHIDSQSNHI